MYFCSYMQIFLMEKLREFSKLTISLWLLCNWMIDWWLVVLLVVRRIGRIFNWGRPIWLYLLCQHICNIYSSVQLLNSLMPIGSNPIHENSSMSSPDFATLLTSFSWPARNRHPVACIIDYFTYLLGWPLEAAVWCMSEWRAVEIEQARI